MPYTSSTRGQRSARGDNCRIGNATCLASLARDVRIGNRPRPFLLGRHGSCASVYAATHATTAARSMERAMWHHGAILTFVDRLSRDSEFREWFVYDPREALASYGLDESDLHYMDQALRFETQQREVAEALRPFVRMLLEALTDRKAEPTVAYARLTSEIGGLKDRLADARARDKAARPWWKFWLW